MEKQVTELIKWLLVDTEGGVMCYPLEDITSLDVSDASKIEVHKAYGARLSMPGYLDCTDWTVHCTPQEAWNYLEETYED